MKLHQIIALVQGKKSRAMKMLTSVHHGWSKERTGGLVRIYKPLDDDGEQFPAESRIVQIRVSDELKKVQEQLRDFYNIVATQEVGNTTAAGTIVVEGIAVADNVPVTVLLFLDKQLGDLRTLASKVPTLPTDRVWKKDDAKNCWVTESEKSVKTQKVVEPIVKYAATKEHPAQTDLIKKDKTIGHWDVIHLSGALPETERNALVERIETLQDAVKVAREEANSKDVGATETIGEAVLSFIFKSE